MKKRFLPVIAALLAAFIILPAACVEPNAVSNQPTTGRLEVRVTDAPPNKTITSIEVTVASVEINKAETATEVGGWEPLGILAGKETFDLLQVQGLEQLLTVQDLSPGVYNQIRMEVTKVEVTFEGEAPVEATLPSGKLKFVRPFEITAGQTTVLLFDFIASQSIHTTGNSKVMFKPVIKLTMTKTPGSMEITTPTLPNGLAGTAYPATTLAAMGGTAPYTWSVKSGTLPTGLALDPATGTISGTPTSAGDSTFTIRVEDNSAVKKAAEKAFTVNIAVSGVQIATTNLDEGMVGALYTATPQVLGGAGPFAWALTAGNLPPGLVLDSGIITGTPTTAGDFNFTITVNDSTAPTALTDSQTLTIHIVAAITA